LNWYAFLVGAGASMAIWRIIQSQKKSDDLQWAIAGLWLLLGAWAGARMAFFIWQPAAIVDFGWKALGLREGGMVWTGAVIGAWITIFMIALAKKRNWLEAADQLLVMLPPLAIMSWLAGWISGSGYGPEMPAAWWVPMTMDDRFQILPRFPLQWIAAASLFLIFMLMETNLPKLKTGRLAALIWSIFTVHTLVFSFFRADPRPVWMGFPWDIWFVFVCGLWAIILIWIAFFRKEKKIT
jgi:prolipoprotein diacylglyceryltransferase